MINIFREWKLLKREKHLLDLYAKREGDLSVALDHIARDLEAYLSGSATDGVLRSIIEWIKEDQGGRQAMETWGKGR